jgi:hypothetical protein
MQEALLIGVFAPFGFIALLGIIEALVIWMQGE